MPQASSAVNVCGLTAGGAEGKGCVGDVTSPGTSVCGTGRSILTVRAVVGGLLVGIIEQLAATCVKPGAEDEVSAQRRSGETQAVANVVVDPLAR